MRRKNNVQLSDNFWLFEFNKNMPRDARSVRPHPDLIAILQWVRNRKKRVDVTEGARTVQHHVGVYTRIYGSNWEDKIAWGSRHLPLFHSEFLHAADVCVLDNDGHMFITGDEIYELIIEAREALELDTYIGVGIGKSYAHLDVADREKDATWRYDY